MLEHGCILLLVGSLAASQSRPSVIYATYFGSGINERGHAIAVDEHGSVYIGGETFVGAVPQAQLLPKAYRRAQGGRSYSTVVAKFDPSGAILEYARYLSGNDWDRVAAIAVDHQGCLHVVGNTNSTLFPIHNPFQKESRGPSNGFGSGDGFVLKLDPTGSKLIYSTYLGGTHNDGATSVAVDRSGATYVAGFTLSDDFPTKNAAQSRRKNGEDGFVAKFDSDGRLVYSTYLSGSGHDRALSIAVDPGGYAYVGGVTGSSDFPMVRAYQDRLRGKSDVFLAKLDPAGKLEFCTFFGGGQDEDFACVAVGNDGSLYLAGSTTSPDLPIADALQTAYGGGVGGGGDCFVARLNSAGTKLIHSTYLGGSAGDQPCRAAVDPSGSVYLAGTTEAHDFPKVHAFQPSLSGESDDFLAVLAPDGKSLVLSTFLGGTGKDEVNDLAVDPSGCAYLMGTSQSKDFPVKQPFQPRNAGGGDFVIAKIGLRPDHEQATEALAKAAATRPARAEIQSEVVEPDVVSSSTDIVAAIQASGPQERITLLWTLGEMGAGAKEAAPALTELLKDSDAQVRCLAAVALVRIGADPGPAIPVLIEAVKSANGEIPTHVAWAAWALGKVGKPAAGAIPILIDALKRTSGPMRAYFVRALGAFGPEATSAIAALESLREDKDNELRLAVTSALGKIGAK